MGNKIFSYTWNKETLGRRSALLFGVLLSGGNLLIPRFPLLFLLVGVAMITIGLRAAPLRRLGPVFALLFLIALFWLIRPGDRDIESLIIRYANFIGAIFLLLLYLKKERTQLAIDLAWLMPWIAYQTIATFIIANSISGVFTKIQIPDGGSFNTLFLLLNYHNVIEDSSGLNRPDGVFYEPGVLQIYLNLYLFISLFVFNRKKDIALATASIAATMSTVGIVLAGVQLISYIYDRWHVAKPHAKKRLVAVIIILSPLWVALSTKNIEDKFFGEARGSSMARTFDFLAGLQIISKNPLMGIGFNHKEYIRQAANLPNFSSNIGYESNPERQTSNGVLNMTYSMGIPVAIIFLFGLFRQKLLPKKKIVAVILFVSSLSEALLLTPFFLLFIFSGLLLKSRMLKLQGGGARITDFR